MRSFIAACAIALFVLGTLSGQQRDLHEDLGNLNVRQTTEHYALAGTVSEEKLEHYGRVLEYIHREYARGFSGLLDKKAARKDKQATETVFQVVFLALEAEYEEFTKAYFGEHAEHTSGLYVPSADLLIIRDGRDPDETHGILFHEAFHQFAHRYVPVIPTWLNEGLATYYGTARATRNGLVFNRPRPDYLRLIGDAARRRALVPLVTLMTSTAAEFYDRSPVPGVTGTRRTLCYAQSYTLMSYMINDGDGRGHLRGYIQQLSGAASHDEAQRITREVFTDELLAAMVDPWLAHVKRIAPGQ